MAQHYIGFHLFHLETYASSLSNIQSNGDIVSDVYWQSEADLTGGHACSGRRGPW